MAGMYKFDKSGMGAGDEDGDTPMESVAEEEEYEEILEAGDNIIPVHRMKLDNFKAQLIEHFDILWQKNLVKWPSRTGSYPPPPITERCHS